MDVCNAKLHESLPGKLYSVYKPMRRYGARSMSFQRPITVGVLGAAGTIAPAIIRDLAESDEVAELRLLDLDPDRAQAVADEHGQGKARVQAVDARSVDDLAARLAGSDVLVNTASYRINLEAMAACLTAGCHYIDLGGLYWMTGRQLELHRDFEQAGLAGPARCRLEPRQDQPDGPPWRRAAPGGRADRLDRYRRRRA